MPRLFVLASLFLAALVSPGAADNHLPPSGRMVQLQNADTKLFLAVDRNGRNDGANVNQQASRGQKSLNWAFYRQSNGSYIVESRDTKKYLGVSGGSRSAGGNIIIWRNQRQSDIRWHVMPTGRNCFKLRNQNSGLYMAVAGGRARSGVNVMQWSDVGQRDIIWCWKG